MRKVEQLVADILGVDSCRYHSAPVPTTEATAIPVTGGGQAHGYLSVTAAARWSRPTKEQRQAVVLMAAQLGEILARTRQQTR